MNIAVFGIGNILLSDDGVGVHVVNRLRDEYEFHPHIELIDGGTKGLDLMPMFEGRDKVLILDAANFKKEPGTVDTVEGDRIPAFLSAKLSVHHIGLPDMLFVARLMETTPKEMFLIGIQPGSMETGEGLSDAVQAGLHDFTEKAVQKLKEWGVEVRRK